ncbi:hypothetical protein [Streptomyces sp. NPDC088554]|uniref:hypothetical protein n=1 Tax=Streptomyces sp. NPDC088554 TaxID=3365865 RepID=UPI0038118126
MSVASNLLPANTASMETDISGWTAGANTTLSWATRFYAGARSLGLTATAAGAVRATTVARVPVIAGTVYMAYAYFVNVVAAAGRTAMVTVDWYAAVTGGTALSSSVSNLGPLPNSTLWLTPAPLFITSAPAGAAYASVTVTVTGLTAGATVCTDVVSFGPPALIDSNLLPYATQSVEVDISGWQSQANCTLAHSSADKVEGWMSIQMTATAPGDVQARTVSPVAVTPGVEYFSFAYVKAPAPGLSYRAEIWWYTDAGTVISGAEASQPWTPVASTWHRCSVLGTAPPGSASARVVLRPQASVAGQVWLVDQVLLRAAPLLPGNMLSYSAQGFETTADDWMVEQGCTIARDTTAWWAGGTSLAVTADGSSDPTLMVVTGIPVTPRQVYAMRPYVYHPAGAGQRRVEVILRWYTADGTLITANGALWTITSGAGWRNGMVASGVAPSNAATLRVGFRFLEAVVGTLFRIDEVSVHEGGFAVVADPIAGQYAYRLTVQGLTMLGHAYWSLWRMLSSDGSMMPIRTSTGDTSENLITGDLAVVEDYEAPLGVPVQYYLKTWVGGGSTSYVSFTTAEILILDDPPPTHMVLKDPLSPARSASVAVATLPDWQRMARQGVYPVRSRARPIVITDIRSSKTGTLTLVTGTDEDRRQLDWLFETGSTLLLQCPREWGEDDVYVQVGDVTTKRAVRYAGYGDREWDVPLTEVDRPVGAIAGSADRTWATVLSEHTDWFAVFADAESWLDVYTGGG